MPSSLQGEYRGTGGRVRTPSWVVASPVAHHRLNTREAAPLSCSLHRSAWQSHGELLGASEGLALGARDGAADGAALAATEGDALGD